MGTVSVDFLPKSEINGSITNLTNSPLSSVGSGALEWQSFSDDSILSFRQITTLQTAEWQLTNIPGNVNAKFTFRIRSSSAMTDVLELNGQTLRVIALGRLDANNGLIVTGNATIPNISGDTLVTGNADVTGNVTATDVIATG